MNSVHYPFDCIFVTLLTIVSVNTDWSYVHCEHFTTGVLLLVIKVRFQL